MEYFTYQQFIITYLYGEKVGIFAIKSHDLCTLAVTVVFRLFLYDSSNHSQLLHTLLFEKLLVTFQSPVDIVAVLKLLQHVVCFLCAPLRCL